LVRADLVELKETQGLNQNSYLKGKYGFMKNILVIKVLPKRYQFNGRPSMGVDSEALQGTVNISGEVKN